MCTLGRARNRHANLAGQAESSHCTRGGPDVTKPYEFIKLGAMDVTKSMNFQSLGPWMSPNPMNFYNMGPWMSPNLMNL
jgi:hypothetical protein